MTPPATVSIVDYGIGNLFSVKQALDTCSVTVTMARTAREVENAERLILPGVGSYGRAMIRLKEAGLDIAVKEFAASNRPFLGICVGMQLLFEVSEENGEHPGLGVLPGRVVAIPNRNSAGKINRVPHIGWSRLYSGDAWMGSILDTPGREFSSAYFVHSYAAQTNDAHVLATAYSNGISMVAAVRKGNTYGTQFHPEKSGPEGLNMLRSFVELSSSQK